MIFIFLGIAMFRMAQAFFSLIIQTLQTGRCHLVENLYHVGGSFILEILGWLWWILLSIMLVFYQLFVTVFHWVAWCTMFLWLLVKLFQFGYILRCLPGSPYSHNKQIRRFIQSPGPYVEAYNSRLVLLSSYQDHGWWLVFPSCSWVDSDGFNFFQRLGLLPIRPEPICTPIFLRGFMVCEGDHLRASSLLCFLGFGGPGFCGSFLYLFVATLWSEFWLYQVFSAFQDFGLEGRPAFWA